MKAYQRILFVTDFSETAGHALELAVSLARAFKADLDVLHVLALGADDPVTAEAGMTSTVPSEYDDVVQSRRMARALKPELGILHAAREGHHDLIVLGTHGKSGLRHVMLGSVAERVVQLAACPVLTVRAPGQTLERP